MLVHEFFHLLFIKLFKQKLDCIEFTAFGGIIKTRVKTSFIKEFLIYSGGLIGNVLILILIKLFDLPCEEIIYKYNNLILAINSLPIIPLDGSKILTLFLERILKTRKGVVCSFFVSILTLMMFLIHSFIIRSAPFILMTLLLVFHNICFFSSIDDIILNKIVNNMLKD